MLMYPLGFSFLFFGPVCVSFSHIVDLESEIPVCPSSVINSCVLFSRDVQMSVAFVGSRAVFLILRRCECWWSTILSTAGGNYRDLLNSRNPLCELKELDLFPTAIAPRVWSSSPWKASRCHSKRSPPERDTASPSTGVCCQIFIISS